MQSPITAFRIFFILSKFALQFTTFFLNKPYEATEIFHPNNAVPPAILSIKAMHNAPKARLTIIAIKLRKNIILCKETKDLFILLPSFDIIVNISEIPIKEQYTKSNGKKIAAIAIVNI